MRITKRYKNKEKGQSLVEFGVSAVILLILLAGVVDAGRAFFLYMAMRDAVQEGALFGSYNPSATEQIEDRVARTSNIIQALFDDSQADVDVDIEYTGNLCAGHGITVRLTHSNFRITMPFLGTVLNTQVVPIRASVTDTILTPPCVSSGY